jgi:hypothetical protein
MNTHFQFCVNPDQQMQKKQHNVILKYVLVLVLFTAEIKNSILDAACDSAVSFQ